MQARSHPPRRSLAVTGGTGFIGSRLALRCLAAGDAVRALGWRRSEAEEENAKEIEAHGGEVIEASVGEPDALRAAFEGCAAIFHLAAAQHEANVPDAHFERVNVAGTRNVLEAARAAGARVVHGSTIGVYGGRAGATLDERSPLAPDNVYGRTKLAAESVVRGFAGSVPFAIARISETYGPGDRRLLKLFRSAARGWLLQVGPARNLHHLVHVDDAVDGLLAAREERALGRTFVLAGPRAVESREILAAVAASAGRPVRIARVPLAPLAATAAALETLLRPLGVQPPLHRRRLDFFRKSFSFGLDEARDALGWAPRIEPEAGLRETARWYAERGWIRDGR